MKNLRRSSKWFDITHSWMNNKTIQACVVVFFPLCVFLFFFLSPTKYVKENILSPWKFTSYKLLSKCIKGGLVGRDYSSFNNNMINVQMFLAIKWKQNSQTCSWWKRLLFKSPRYYSITKSAIHITS